MKIKSSLAENEQIQEIADTVQSVCSLHLKQPLIIWLSAFSIGSLSACVENWIVYPAASYYALIVLILADYATGIVIAFKNNKFETRKAIRVFWTLISHTALLYFSMQLSKASAALFWLNEGVFVPLVLVNLLSLIKNLSLLGYIKAGFAEFFYKKIDAYKNQKIEKKD